MLAENLVENEKPLQLRIQYKEGDEIGVRELKELNLGKHKLLVPPCKIYSSNILR